MDDCPEALYFFTWWDGSYRAIILGKDEQEVELERGGPCEEGYYHECETFTLTQHPDNDEWIVKADRYTDARDCDGRFETNSECWCLVSELHKNKSRCGCFPLPEWHKGKASQRDHTAEAAGY